MEESEATLRARFVNHLATFSDEISLPPTEVMQLCQSIKLNEVEWEGVVYDFFHAKSASTLVTKLADGGSPPKLSFLVLLNEIFPPEDGQNSSINEEDVIRRLFDSFDKDKSGGISFEQLVEGLKEMQVYESFSQAERIMKEIDTDGNGEIDFEEFKAGYISAKNDNSSFLGFLSIDEKSQTKETSILSRIFSKHVQGICKDSSLIYNTLIEEGIYVENTQFIDSIHTNQSYTFQDFMNIVENSRTFPLTEEDEKDENSLFQTDDQLFSWMEFLDQNSTESSHKSPMVSPDKSIYHEIVALTTKRTWNRFATSCHSIAVLSTLFVIPTTTGEILKVVYRSHLESFNLPFYRSIDQFNAGVEVGVCKMVMEPEYLYKPDLEESWMRIIGGYEETKTSEFGLTYNNEGAITLLTKFSHHKAIDYKAVQGRLTDELGRPILNAHMYQNSLGEHFFVANSQNQTPNIMVIPGFNWSRALTICPGPHINFPQYINDYAPCGSLVIEGQKLHRILTQSGFMVGDAGGHTTLMSRVYRSETVGQCVIIFKNEHLILSRPTGSQGGVDDPHEKMFPPQITFGCVTPDVYSFFPNEHGCIDDWVILC